MAKWVHSDVLDGGLSTVRNNATKLLLIAAYAAGDSYATVTANKLAEVTMIPGDYALADGAAGSRTLTTTAKNGISVTVGSGATPNLHFAFTNGTDKVLWVTDETSDQVITAGNSVNFPALTYTSQQPV